MIKDNEALVDGFVAEWIVELRGKFANTGQIFDFSDWGKYVPGFRRVALYCR